MEGLSLSAVRVLGAVARGQGRVQPGDVGEQLDMASPNVAAALRELEAQGHVRRERDPEDRRRVNISLTERGTAAVEGHRALKAEWLRTAVEATLDAREQTLLIEAGALLDRVAAWNDEGGR